MAVALSGERFLTRLNHVSILAQFLVAYALIRPFLADSLFVFAVTDSRLTPSCRRETADNLAKFG